MDNLVFHNSILCMQERWPLNMVLALFMGQLMYHLGTKDDTHQCARSHQYDTCIMQDSSVSVSQSR